jgi:hypothetical protein
MLTVKISYIIPFQKSQKKEQFADLPFPHLEIIFLTSYQLRRHPTRKIK